MVKTPIEPGLEWQVTIRLPSDLADKVRRLARSELTPPAVMLRRLVKERLEQIPEDARASTEADDDA